VGRGDKARLPRRRIDTADTSHCHVSHSTCAT
jgi:hypothetical protein